MTTALATSRPQGAPASAACSPRSSAPIARRLAPDLEQEALLIVRRQDIEFTDIGPGRVEIAITVTNLGAGRSAATVAQIASDPLGAFVDWRPLTSLFVPALEPGKSVLLRTEAERVIPEPLGPPDRVPPARWLTASAFGEEKPSAPMTSFFNVLARSARKPETPRAVLGRTTTQAPPTSRHLPPSPFDFLSGPTTYWAGNLNVFVGGQAVERHQATALRIIPGRTNVAMFIVGCGPDSYQFDLVGLGPEWDARIFDPMRATSVSRALSDGMVIEPGAWTAVANHALWFLVLRPPANCRTANVEVRVTQRSTRKTAIVEFSFDPRASGPGCYVVE
jgi:hypothetical protein